MRDLVRLLTCLLLGFLVRHTIFLWLKTGTLQNNEPCGTYHTWSMQLFWIPIVKTPTKTKIMHSAKKKAVLILHICAIILFLRQYVLQEVFARLYFLVKITAEKVSNVTGDKGFHILLLSEHMLFIREKILSKEADAPGLGLYWVAECITGTFCLTDRDAGTKPSNRDCPG